MTVQERKRCEKFERDLRDYPVKAMMFFANMVKAEDKDYPYAEQKAICEHLGIVFNEDDHRVDEVAVAKEWAAKLPDMNY